jgi:hypothetical protein
MIYLGSAAEPGIKPLSPHVVAVVLLVYIVELCACRGQSKRNLVTPKPIIGDRGALEVDTGSGVERWWDVWELRNL